MGWAFRKRIKVIPGVTINLSKSGISTSVGVRGASLTFRSDGVYRNLGLPGTGIYSREKVDAYGRQGASRRGEQRNAPQRWSLLRSHPTIPSGVQTLSRSPVKVCWVSSGQ